MRKYVMAGAVCLAALAGSQSSASALSLFGLHIGPHGEYRVAQSPRYQDQLSAAPDAPGANAPVYVQSSSNELRIQQLEDSMRQMNGRLEDMSYQLLKMQEDMRKAQQDNEFRFQQLEKRGGGGGGASGSGGTTTIGGGSMKKSEADPAPGSPGARDDVASVIQDPSASAGAPQGVGQGAPPTQLGSIQFDQNGNPVGATVNSTADNGSGPPPSGDGTAPMHTASLGNENDSYKAAYGHVLSGDYSTAETEFRNFISSYPSSSRLADANFWLGESLYSQGKFNDAARTFLDAHQKYSTSEKAPEMLLKLGMSLAALDDKDTACATLHEVSKRYPKATRAVNEKVASEEKRLAC